MLSRQVALAAGVVCALGLPAWAAEDQDGGIEPSLRSANPGGAEVPGDLLRHGSLEGVAARSPAGDGGTGATETGPVPAQSPAPTTPELVARSEEAGSPDRWVARANLSASIRASYQVATRFPLDPDTAATIAPLVTRVRASPELRLKGLGLIAEADAATGAVFGLPAPALAGRSVPTPPVSALELRKLYLEYQWNAGAFRVGQQTSKWGLGLVANDGAKDAEAGSFGQQQFGALVYRALLAFRPLIHHGRLAALETALAADVVVRDSTAELARGDRALQGVLALRLVKDADNQAGMYLVYRSQRPHAVSDGSRSTDVAVVDVAGSWDLIKRSHRAAKVGAEIAAVFGRTTFGRNPNAPTLEVRQLGAVAQASYRIRSSTVYLDLGYASGDHNPNDGLAESFRFDRDYKVGLILFDQVLAWQSARTVVRASNVELTGVPPEGVDLLGTGGAVSGAWYLFPRVKVRVAEWCDVYGGPLFAFSTAALTDPYFTRLGGGTPRNSLAGRPGRFLGSEVDLGMQARFRPLPELGISLTAEGGLFLPGDAFALEAGGAMAPVGFARLRASVAL